MRNIELEKWDRIEHFEFFKNAQQPQYNLCFPVDITRFLNGTREKELPFYYAMIFAATETLNRFEAFRYRMHGEDVVLYDRIHPSFTDLDKGSELFKFVTVELTGGLTEFAFRARELAREQKCCFPPDVREDVVYITCIPWISFTHISHTYSGDASDAIPRISWGKYYREGEKVLLPFSVQVHHAFVDGLQVGRYAEALQDCLNADT